MSMLKDILAVIRYGGIPPVRPRQEPAYPKNLRGAYRMFAAARSSRLTTGWGASGQSSMDTEIISSLRELRARSREMIRDAAFAKRAKTIVVNNVVGSGIGLQAQVKTTRGDLNKRVNADIEACWEEWCKAPNCHTGGALHFADIERMAMGQVFEAGEIFIRKHFRPFGYSPVPFALEVIEPERVIDEFQPSAIDPAKKVRIGVEMDEYQRASAYYIRTIHPGETRMNAWEVDRIERVPASQIIHLRIIDRWPQTRGVPWMHAAMRKLIDTDGYSEAEIIRARGAANYMATVKTDRAYGDPQEDKSRQINLEPGTVEVLYEGEEMNFHASNSPNPSADPFLRYMLREVAAAIGVSYESLSRDYSQSNYSSSRLALLDDRDLWRVVQMWFIRGFRVAVHNDFLQAAVLSRSLPSIPVESYALDPAAYQRVRFKPRGWNWVDPTKEVEAYKEAIKAGLTTRTDVIAQTANGRDIEDIDEERKQELERQEEMDLAYDVDPEMYEKEEPAEPAPAKPAAPEAPGEEDEPEERKGTAKHGRPQRVRARL